MSSLYSPMGRAFPACYGALRTVQAFLCFILKQTEKFQKTIDILPSLMVIYYSRQMWRGVRVV